MITISSIKLWIAAAITFTAFTPQLALSDADQIRVDVEILASDEYDGRRPGTEGIEKAATYIEERFMDLGLTETENGHRQTFNVVENLELGENNMLALSMIVPRRGIPKERLKPVTRKLEVGSDYTPFYYSGDGDAQGQLVFAGFGISNPAAGYDDYQEIDIKDKIAIILSGTPEGEVSTQNYQGMSDPFYKIENAQNQGAAGVILIGMNGDSANVLPKMGYMDVIGRPDIPVVFAQRKKIEKFFPNSHSLITLENQILETKNPASMALEDRSAKLAVELKPKIVETANIVGIVEGIEDPDRFIVIGAHYDHLGRYALNTTSKNSYGHIHNGADDNASGTALLLDLASKISKSPLQKSVLFIAFSSEEMGLLGSHYFTENPTVKLESVVAMINLDMVGMLKDELTVFGTGSARGLDVLVNQAAAQANIETKNVNLPHGPSDHMHFYRNDIPAMHIFTGLHPHFHSPADDVENLNFEGIDKIGDFVYALSSGLALAEIDFMHAEAASQDDYVFGETTLHNRPTGIYTSFKVREEGVELLDIVRQSRAWQAGLRPGDVITKVNGKNVNSTTALRYNIRDIVSRLTAENLRAGVPIDMTIERNGEEMSVQVEL
jgi:hypothetical protein